MCIYTLYLFTHCHHHCFSKHARHHCPTETAHLLSLSNPTTQAPAPRCTLKKAHPFTARLVHAPCPRCKRLLEPAAFHNPPVASRPGSSSGPAAAASITLASTTNPQAEADPALGASQRIVPELSREAHPAIMTVPRPPWSEYAIPLYALPSPRPAADDDDIRISRASASTLDSSAPTTVRSRSVASAETASTAPSSIAATSPAHAHAPSLGTKAAFAATYASSVFARVSDAAAGAAVRARAVAKDERHRPLVLCSGVYNG